MSFEIAAAAVSAFSPTAAAATPLQAGYGVSLSDLGGFQQAMARLEARGVGGVSESAKQLMAPFERINAEASKLSLDANAAKAAGREMSPSEVISLTMRCQEFMFHCQLTSNIANRTSDGLQQLFRQQA